MKKRYSMQLLGLVLSTVISQEIVHANQFPISQLNLPSIEQKNVATLIADLIDKGYITIEPVSGKLIIKSDILSILKEYQLIDESKIIMTDGGRTGGMRTGSGTSGLSE